MAKWAVVFMLALTTAQSAAVQTVPSGQRKRLSPTTTTEKPSVPKQSDEEAAGAVVDIFMRGIKLIALPEGKQMLRNVQWITGLADYGKNFYSRPVYSDATTLFQGLFDADIEGIKGYKRLMELKAVSQAKTPLIVRFLVIAFKDNRTGQWKVLDSGTDDSVDIEQSVRFFAANLKNTQVTSAQDNYLTYGQWLLKAGRIVDAKNALDIAADSKTQPDGSSGLSAGPEIIEVHRAQIKALLDVISRITVERDAGPKPE